MDSAFGGRIAVKVINHLGDEVMKVFLVEQAQRYGRFRSLRRRYMPTTIAIAAKMVTGTR